MSVAGLKQLIECWFYSDLDIEFTLKEGRRSLLCTFESDVWYEHINDPRRQVTIKSIRHEGDHRRFVVWEGDDDLYEAVKDHCHILYDKNQLIELVEMLGEQYKIA